MAAAAQMDVAKAVSAAFLQFDTGSKGYLTRHELRAAHLALLGHLPSLVELDALLPKRADGAPCGIELPELCEALERKLALQDPDEVVRRAFRAFDASHKGFVSLADLEAVMASVAPHLPRETVRLIFAQLDTDRDGRVSYKDFHTMVRRRPRTQRRETPPSTAPAPARAQMMARPAGCGPPLGTARRAADRSVC